MDPTIFRVSYLLHRQGYTFVAVFLAALIIGVVWRLATPQHYRYVAAMEVSRSDSGPIIDMDEFVSAAENEALSAAQKEVSRKFDIAPEQLGLSLQADAKRGVLYVRTVGSERKSDAFTALLRNALNRLIKFQHFYYENEVKTLQAIKGIEKEYIASMTNNIKEFSKIVKNLNSMQSKFADRISGLRPTLYNRRSFGAYLASEAPIYMREYPRFLLNTMDALIDKFTITVNFERRWQKQREMESEALHGDVEPSLAIRMRGLYVDSERITRLLSMVTNEIKAFAMAEPSSINATADSPIQNEPSVSKPELISLQLEIEDRIFDMHETHELMRKAINEASARISSIDDTLENLRGPGVVQEPVAFERQGSSMVGVLFLSAMIGIILAYLIAIGLEIRSHQGR